MDDFNDLNRKLDSIKSIDITTDIIEDEEVKDIQAITKALEIYIKDGVPYLKYGKYKDRELMELPLNYVEKMHYKITYLMAGKFMNPGYVVMSDAYHKELQILLYVCTYKLKQDSHSNNFTELSKFEFSTSSRATQTNITDSEEGILKNIISRIGIEDLKAEELHNMLNLPTEQEEES